jgi:hypothetical protein
MTSPDILGSEALGRVIGGVVYLRPSAPEAGDAGVADQAARAEACAVSLGWHNIPFYRDDATPPDASPYDRKPITEDSEVQ